MGVLLGLDRKAEISAWSDTRRGLFLAQNKISELPNPRKEGKSRLQSHSTDYAPLLMSNVSERRQVSRYVQELSSVGLVVEFEYIDERLGKGGVSQNGRFSLIKNFARE